MPQTERKGEREMIIKFSHGITTETEKWEVFGNIDHYNFCQHKPSVCPKEFDFSESVNQNRLWDISIFKKNETKPIEIIAHSPIFVLEDGRTVDKI